LLHSHGQISLSLDNYYAAHPHSISLFHAFLQLKNGKFMFGTQGQHDSCKQ